MIKYDQHFLIDEEVLEKTITIANIRPNDIVFEIGPGLGVLTKRLLEKNPKKLISIEKDESLKPALEEIKRNQNNFEFKISDGILEIDNCKFTKLIANIPYSITEPLYKKILDKKISFVLLLHGKTFYDTIVSRQSKWNSFVNAFYDIELIDIVEGEKFEPKTKTKSVLILLTLKDNLDKNDEILQCLWSKRERNVKNAVIYSLVDMGKTKKEAKKIFNEMNVEEKIKSKIFDNLSNEEFEFISRLNSFSKN